jgi:hypothetical protein
MEKKSKILSLIVNLKISRASRGIERIEQSRARKEPVENFSEKYYNSSNDCRSSSLSIS